jgi:anti-anti-sigma factor
MEISVSTENGRVPVTVMKASGNIDTNTAGAFLSRAEELIEGGARHILVDLANVPYMSSAGLRALNAIFNQLRSLDKSKDEKQILKEINDGTYKSPHLKLLDLSKQTLVAFETAGFDMYLETFTDLKTAINAF